MSIINLEKTFENEQLVYFNLDNKIIECTCLSKLFKYSLYNSVYCDNEDLGTFTCNKVKIITIYDIYKNIIYKPIQTDLFKDLIKIGGILENLERKNIYFFKTFIGSFIRNNKLNDIEYDINYNGSIKNFNIYNNEKDNIYEIHCNGNLIIYKNYYGILEYRVYDNYNDIIEYRIYNNYIEIKKGKYPYYKIIKCYRKNLKILEVDKYNGSIEGIHEERNNNNEITYLNGYNTNKMYTYFLSNNTNPPFSKPLKKCCIELIDYYNKNINNHNESIKTSFKKKKEIQNNLLLNCKIEMINFF